MSMKKRVLLLSFDVEEFDTPVEYGIPLPWDRQIALATEGLHVVESLCAELGARATFFTTCSYAREAPDMVRRIADSHEIASHGWTHGDFSREDASRSRMFLQEASGQPVRGFRRARMGKTPTRWLHDAGYTYDSSDNPTWLPGRYNNLHLRRTPRLEDGLWRIPASVTPLCRLPLFWLTWKHLPSPLLAFALRATLARDGHLALYFHPWEFAELARDPLCARLPRLITRLHGARLADLLRTRLSSLIASGATWQTYSDFADNLASPG